MAASVLLEDRHVSYRGIGTLFEVEQTLRRIAKSFEQVMEFQKRAAEADSFRFIVEVGRFLYYLVYYRIQEGANLFDELIDCIVAIKSQLRSAMSSRSTLRLLPLLTILGTRGEFRTILYRRQ